MCWRKEWECAEEEFRIVLEEIQECAEAKFRSRLKERLGVCWRKVNDPAGGRKNLHTPSPCFTPCLCS